MSHADLQYRLVQGPGGVHLHVGFLDGRHRAQGIHTGDEGKGGALQVVAAAGTDEIHVLGVVYTDLGVHRLQLRHDELHLVGGAGPGQAVGLAESHNCNLLHRINPPSQ